MTSSLLKKWLFPERIAYVTYSLVEIFKSRLKQDVCIDTFNSILLFKSQQWNSISI